LIVIGAAALGIGFVVMAVAPTLAIAIAGAAFAGIGNGVEAVAARTALQEETEERWMALMMSLNESLFQSVPGAGILLGGAITALGSPRTALAIAGAGSLVVTVAAWFALAPLSMATPPAAHPRPPGPANPTSDREGGRLDPDRGSLEPNGAGPNGAALDPNAGGAHHEPPSARVVRHQ
jgi:MFS family permease